MKRIQRPAQIDLAAYRQRMTRWPGVRRQILKGLIVRIEQERLWKEDEDEAVTLAASPCPGAAQKRSINPYESSSNGD